MSKTVKALLTACALAATAGATLAQEQVVNLYSARHYSTDEALYTGFTKATGIKINRVDADDAGILARLKAEGSASPADVILLVDAARLYKGEVDGLFQPIQSKVLNDAIPANLRSALLGEQNANAARIATLRAQIAALGPSPGEGVPEVEEIAQRRAVLTEQLVTLQAPGLAAEEAYRRADGLIAEIDRVLRERQADQLLKLWPAPINPANWPEALIGVTDTGVRIWEETAEKWADPKARTAFGDNVPFILLLLALAVGLLVYGRSWVQDLSSRLQDRASLRGRKILALFASLGEIAFPLVGIMCVLLALSLTEMQGEVGARLVDAAGDLALFVILAAWLAGQVLPRGVSAGPFGLPSERRAEARYNAVLMAALLGLDGLRFAAMDAQSYSEGTTSVASFPLLAVSGLLLFRMGQLLHRHLLREGERHHHRLLGRDGGADQFIEQVGEQRLVATGDAQGPRPTDARGNTAAGHPVSMAFGLLGDLTADVQRCAQVRAVDPGRDHCRHCRGTGDAQAGVVGHLAGLQHLLHPVCRLLAHANGHQAPHDVADHVVQERIGFEFKPPVATAPAQLRVWCGLPVARDVDALQRFDR